MAYSVILHAMALTSVEGRWPVGAKGRPVSCSEGKNVPFKR